MFTKLYKKQLSNIEKMIDDAWKNAFIDVKTDSTRF